MNKLNGKVGKSPFPIQHIPYAYPPKRTSPIMIEEREAVPHDLSSPKGSLLSSETDMALLSVVLILVVLGLILLFRIKDNKRLNMLMQQIQKKRDKDSEDRQESATEEGDSDDRLYRQLCDIMLEEELFRDPQLNREILADRLGTNHVYLTKAIRRHCKDGTTVGEFINGYRLRYARALLIDKPKLSVDKVIKMSGFNSRTTFGRLFLTYYGMSPSKYRAFSKGKRERKNFPEKH